jgi:uncharacterized protein YjbJ (UPF0337 family)
VFSDAAAARTIPLRSRSETATAQFQAPSRIVTKHTESAAMDKNRIAGSTKEVTGAAKEAAGKVIGDAKLQSDGKTEKAVGKVQNAVGGVNDAVRDALKKP